MAERWMRLTVALGVGLRFAAVIDRWHGPVSNDTSGFLAKAADLRWVRPWESADRESLWIVAVKVIAGPFGYTYRPLLVLSAAAAVAALPLAVVVLGRMFRPGAALAGVAVLAIHPLLVADAASALRESLTLLLLLGLAWVALERRWNVAAALIAVAFGIRWEIGMLTMALLVLGVVTRRIDWRVPALAVGLAAVWTAPLMVSNAADRDDPMYHSNVHAGFYMAYEANLNAGTGRSLPPEARPRISWADYYLHHLGPAESLERAAHGVVNVPASLVANAPWGLTGWAPHDPHAPHFEVGGIEKVAGLVIFAIVVAGAMWHRAGRMAIILFVGGLAGYAGLGNLIRYRLVSFLVLPLGVMVAASVHHALAQRAGRRGGGVTGDLRDIGPGQAVPVGPEAAELIEVRDRNA